MKISYQWLKDFVQFDQSPQAIADMLTFQGLETNVATSIVISAKDVVTAQVVSVEKHPQADKLSVCAVTDGTRTYTVVCGAPNVAAGQVVPLALIGAELPGGLKIRKAKLRGVESEGMICSEKELGLSAESAGIMVLPQGTSLGRQIEELLKSDDTILDVDIVTNRGDCLSHWGIAREIAAKLGTSVSLPKITPVELPASVSVTIDDKDLCSRYIGIRIDGVTVRPSPGWMARRLEKCGLRPINNIVDITNYVLMELGHPLHAFDAARLDAEKIVVRRARSGENICALDGRKYPLADSMLVIADASRPQAIAGVMGGEESGVTEKTANIILESAIFSPGSVRRTAKSLNIMTDASYRFERGTSWEVCELASWRALSLIQELAGGAARGRADARTASYVPVTIELRPERARRLLGLTYTDDEIRNTLVHLGISCTKPDEGISCSIPSWRLDLKQEVDLIEEVARVNGYDRIPVTILPLRPDPSQGRTYTPAVEIVRHNLVGLGFCEAVNSSFAEERELARFHLAVTEKVANPISKENEVLRTSMIIGLWRNLLLNRNQGFSDIKLFETGHAFPPEGERAYLAFIAAGDVLPDWWKWEGKDIPVSLDFFYLNGMVNSALSSDGANRGAVRILPLENGHPFLHPGKSASIELNGKRIGVFGMLRPEYSEEAGEAGYAEFSVDELERSWTRTVPCYQSMRRQPPVHRDISIVVSKDIPFERINETLTGFVGTAMPLVEWSLFSIYSEEKKIGQGNTSYSLHLLFRHPQKTLTDADVNEQVSMILKKLGSEFGITLRQ